MEYFHGTVVKGLSVLKPNASPFSNLKEPVVYLTTNKQLAGSLTVLQHKKYLQAA